MADNNQLEQMKQKYASVLAAVQQQQVQLSHVHIQDNKLFIQGIAPSEQAKNKVWDEIKRVNPNWAQELTADITVDAGSQQTPSASGGGQLRTYTVQAGDTLSKISRDVYGNTGAYMKIFDANRDVLSDPDKIRPGQTLKIPAA
jgi:cell envelope opacity-associated protein A